MAFDDELDRVKSSPAYQEKYGWWKGKSSAFRMWVGALVIALIAVAVFYWVHY